MAKNMQSSCNASDLGEEECVADKYAACFFLHQGWGAVV
jgi:hypothetical protein